MHHVEAVHVVDCDGHLRKYGERIVLLEWALGEQLLEEFASAETLLHDEYALRVADNLDEVDNVPAGSK